MKTMFILKCFGHLLLGMGILMFALLSTIMVFHAPELILKLYGAGGIAMAIYVLNTLPKPRPQQEC